MSRLTYSFHQCSVLLCFLCLILLPSTRYVVATLAMHHAGDNALSDCGHDHVAAAQEGLPITYVSLGRVTPSATQAEAADSPSLGATAALSQPPQPHHIVEVQAANSGGSDAATWAPTRIAVWEVLWRLHRPRGAQDDRRGRRRLCRLRRRRPHLHTEQLSRLGVDVSVLRGHRAAPRCGSHLLQPAQAARVERRHGG